MIDDFQHRLLVALERLAGRGDVVGTLEVGDRLDMLNERLSEVVAELSSLEVLLEDIRDRLPPAGP